MQNVDILDVVHAHLNSTLECIRALMISSNFAKCKIIVVRDILESIDAIGRQEGCTW